MALRRVLPSRKYENTEKCSQIPRFFFLSFAPVGASGWACALSAQNALWPRPARRGPEASRRSWRKKFAAPGSNHQAHPKTVCCAKKKRLQNASACKPSQAKLDVILQTPKGPQPCHPAVASKSSPIATATRPIAAWMGCVNQPLALCRGHRPSRRRMWLT